jgi:hypothetical protein
MVSFLVLQQIGGVIFLYTMQIEDDEDLRQKAIDQYRQSTDSMLKQFEEYKHDIRNDPDYKDSSEEDFTLFEEMNEEDRFSKIKYEDRRFVFFVQDENHVSGCYDETKNINWVFTLDKYPSEIVFPNGHPQANTLYIGHPLHPTMYAPLEDAENLFFIDEVHVFCWLCQCLGATEISFHTIKGLDVRQNYSVSKNANADLNVRITKANGIYKSSRNSESKASSKSAMEMSQIFSPKKKPYVPEDCKDWINAKSDWKQLVKQRIEGNMLSYTQHILSSEFYYFTTNQKMNVQASFSNLMVKANGSFDADSDYTFTKTQESEWEISVSFMPTDKITVNGTTDQIDVLSTTTNKDMTDDEQQYQEEVQFCLEDGNIDSSIRKLLERKRIKLGISKVRAEEIEKICISHSSFSKEEQEYIDALKEAVDDGAISNSARRLLERERKSLGITEVRAKEIESLVLR